MLSSLLYLANCLKKYLYSLLSIIFLSFFLFLDEETTPPAPFLIAFLINLLPSYFFPFSAKNKLSFLIVLVSIERPLKFNDIFFPKILLNIDLFCKKFLFFLLKF